MLSMLLHLFILFIFISQPLNGQSLNIQKKFCTFHTDSSERSKQNITIERKKNLQKLRIFVKMIIFFIQMT